MTLLVTGGTGFVMSNFIVYWLEKNPEERAVVVDLGAIDGLSAKFFEPVKDRISFVTGDIADQAVWDAVPPGVTHVVHGAAMTPSGEAEERSKARGIVAANVMGTANVLDWAGRQGSVRRFILVGTGGVYVDEDPRGAGLALPEEGFVEPEPRRLYAITKRSAELIARRLAELWSLPFAVVRLSGVYGPMDRPTIGRRVRCVPNRVCHLALAGKTIRVSGADAVGDYVYVKDVASALAALVDADGLEHPTYNIAAGAVTSVEAILDTVRSILPDTRWVSSDPADADVVENPAKATGKWGAYDTGRLRALGWSPTPLRDGLADYLDWIRESRAW
jgi:UDP-glucose 4-epimerase